MKRCFVYLRNEEKGPYTIQQLKDLRIDGSTLVRFEGTANWSAASNFPELRAVIVGNTGSSHGNSQFSSRNKRSSSIIVTHDNSDELVQQRRKKARMFFLGILIAAVAVGFFLTKRSQTDPQDIPGEAVVITQKDSPVTTEVAVEKTVIPDNALNKERTKPGDFLRVVSTFHENSTAQDIITGFISSSATVVSYKKVEFTVFYLDRAGTALDTEVFTVNQSIASGQVVAFKFKVNAPVTTFKTDVAFNDATVDEINTNAQH